MKNRQRRTAYRTGASVSALVLAMALASPAEATCSFGVQTKTCDATTTTQNDINQGILNILVGFAPLKPAEFIILRIALPVAG